MQHGARAADAPCLLAQTVLTELSDAALRGERCIIQSVTSIEIGRCCCL